MISRLSSSCDWRRLSLLKSPSGYFSTTSKASPTKKTKKKSPFVFTDYLMHSLGFSTEEAVASAKKVAFLPKSMRNNPDSVLCFLKKLGLTETQIKLIVSTSPRVLLSNVDKTLKPKIRVLQDLDLSKSEVVTVVAGYKSFLFRGFNSEIKPAIDYLRTLLGTDINAGRAIVNCTSLLNRYAPKKITASILVLEELGFSKENVVTFVLQNSRCLLREHSYLKEIAKKVENEYMVSRDSKLFPDLVRILSCLGKSKIDLKLKTFRSFGMSDANIYKMVRKWPIVLSYSETRLQNVVEFFNTQFGYKLHYLASHPALFCFDFEKRVKPRSEVIKVLIEKNLVKRSHLYRALCVKESVFVKKFVLPHEDMIPDLYASPVKTAGLMK